MRDYAKCSPRLWTGEFGRAIRGDANAQALAWYLLTSPHSNMMGLYYLPKEYAAADLGWGIDGVSQALSRLCSTPFVRYDEALQVVFVVEAARHELGEELSPKDTKVKPIRKILREHRKSAVFKDFVARYGSGYAAALEGIDTPCDTPCDTPPMPFLARDQDQEQEQEQEQEQDLRDVGNPPGLPTDLPVQKAIPGTKPRPAKKPPWATRAEIAWRVTTTWESFLARRATYYGRTGFAAPPGRPPTLTDDIKDDIVRSLRVHDGELMGAGDREEWTRDSKTRAAGEGLYLKSWNLGMREGAEENGKRKTKYLEPWRPWKIRKNRDPVDEFAEVYFEKRAAHEAAGGSA